jgi:hypothetical protein
MLCKFGANAAWLALNVIAHNLCRWMGRLGGFAIACLKAWRLRLPADWPWREELMALLAKLHAVAVPFTT